MDDSGVAAGTDGSAEPHATRWDPDIHLDPDETAIRLSGTPGLPIAGPGLAGFAIERATERLVHVGGEMQWDMLNEPRIGPGHGAMRAERGAERAATGFGTPGDELAKEAAAARPPAAGRRRSWQLNVRLSDEERDQVDRAAARCGVRRTTLARVLVLRGSKAILADSPD